MNTKSLKTVALVAIASLTIGTAHASKEDFEGPIMISATGGATTIVAEVATTIANPAVLAVGLVSYAKFILIYAPIALVVMGSINLSSKYKNKKMAKAQAQAALMKGEDMASLPQNLRNTVDDLRRDIRTTVADKSLSPEVQERIDSTDTFDKDLNSDLYLVTILANL